MGNIKSPLLIGHFTESGVNIRLCNGIQSCCGLVRDQNRRIFIKGSGQKQTLLLPTGKINGFFIQLLYQQGILFFRQPLHPVIEIYQLQALLQASLIFLPFGATGYIFSDGGDHRVDFLKNRSKQTAVFLSVKFPGGNPVYPNLSCCGFQKATQKLDARGFPPPFIPTSAIRSPGRIWVNAKCSSIHGYMA